MGCLRQKVMWLVSFLYFVHHTIDFCIRVVVLRNSDVGSDDVGPKSLSRGRHVQSRSAS